MDNCIQLKSISPFHHRFMYIDTEEHISVRLFASLGIRMRRAKVMCRPGSPFHLIACYIRKRDTEKFIGALSRLRDNAMILGYRDYEKMCKLLKEAEIEAAGCGT